MHVAPLVLALTLSAAAAPKTGKWVALVHTEGEIPASWPETLRKAAEGVKDGRVWTEPPAVTLVEAQAALGCAGWGPSCAAQVAQMTGATTALLVDVTGTGAGVGLSSEAVLASNGQAAKGKHEVLLPDTSDDSLRYAVAWVKGSLVDKLPALLIVDTATPGGEVRFDGKRVGTTEHGPVRIVVEAPGSHTLLVTKEGSAPVTREVRLAANETVKELVALSAEGPPVDPKVHVGDPSVITPKVTDPPQPPATADGSGAVVGWSVTGAGALVTLAAGAFAGTVAWDLYFARVPCGAANDKSCVPQTVTNPLGLYHYDAPDREQFFATDGPLMLSLAAVGVGVGGLLAGTGVWLALTGPGEAAETAP
ncbi:MAG: PEGA domain-containing protein [Deltaproteobacteria bacterium]|nr:PEGA domain-containing protein [Deltaproteobacteria bacterium]